MRGHGRALTTTTPQKINNHGITARENNKTLSPQHMFLAS